MERCTCGHERRSHMGGRCWWSRGCARDTDPHAICSSECKAGRVCECTTFEAAKDAQLITPTDQR